MYDFSDIGLTVLKVILFLPHLSPSLLSLSLSQSFPLSLFTSLSLSLPPSLSFSLTYVKF